MEDKIKTITEEGSEAIGSANSLRELEELRVKYIGKRGALTSLLRSIGQLDDAQRPRMGQLVNNARQKLDALLEERSKRLSLEETQQRLLEERIDITMPGRRPAYGTKHPLTSTLDDIKRVFMGLGFEVVEGPEVELDYYNFEALNVPKDHPARDMQDTFYISDEVLLRTQTSPVQIRVMEEAKPPIKIIAPGKVYRCDSDVTHSPMFHQVEGLAVGKNITFGDLKGTLSLFATALFGEDTPVRFRPSYFPFTEPSAEMDIGCVICRGEGCRLCKGTGWLEVLGAGMVHPNVLQQVNYDPDEVGGFAFGMGVERIAMLRYEVDDIRLFFDNDLRLLNQF
ncbi:MAG: phenylalanine--tRNA ligase subunit alpha [Limnochordia bacterium]|nr:phenylalanine--tRNA ligase subunit alpha [Limnochordia bacterium]MDD2630361.1 phenylalanine--tRNA ligase subunit alpha [Limnochordia bacterium]MDD4517885.1 phenylalanine--tRNA ligase subunit alpha [Limnochordia bacterium]